MPILYMHLTIAMNRTAKSTAGVRDARPIRHISVASPAATTPVKMFVVKAASKGMQERRSPLKLSTIKTANRFQD
jgi:hypothetical protein